MNVRAFDAPNPVWTCACLEPLQSLVGVETSAGPGQSRGTWELVREPRIFIGASTEFGKGGRPIFFSPGRTHFLVKAVARQVTTRIHCVV